MAIADDSNTHKPKGPIHRKTDMVVRELIRLKVDIASLSEVRWLGNGITKIGKHTFLFSGLPDTGNQEKKEGVAIVLSPDTTKFWENGGSEWEPVSSRIIRIRLCYGNRYVTKISVYAPTFKSSHETKERFYSDLQNTIDKVPPDDILLLNGDFNARVGTHDSGIWKHVIGKYNMPERNEQGERLLEFCAINGLSITNTFFQHKSIHQGTWMHPRSKKWHCIDFNITKQRDRKLFMNTRVMRSAEMWTDHHLVRSTLSVKSKSRCKPTSHTRYRYDIDCLKDARIEKEFSQACKNALDNSDFDKVVLTDDTEKAWSNIRDAINKAGKEILGVKKKKKDNWFYQNMDLIQPLLDKKYAAWSNYLKSKNSKSDSTQLSKFKQRFSHTKIQLQKLIRQLKNQWWLQKASEIQLAADKHNTKKIYQLINSLNISKDYQIKSINVKDKNGKILSTEAESLERWKEHFEGVFNKPSKAQHSILESIEQRPIQHHLGDVPTLEEVESAFASLPSGKTCGQDSIVAEMIKAAKLNDKYHDLIKQVWKTRTTPTEWRDALIKTVPKKGDITICDNNRSIFLLCVFGKGFAKIINRRMQELAEQILPESQSGFRKHRGTTDMIFVARLLIEKAKEQNCPIHMAFVDLAKAFDCVDRHLAWNLFKKAGLPEVIIQLLEALHTGMQATIEVNGRQSTPAHIESGFRQGCVLAPTEFGLFFGEATKHWRKVYGHLGAKLTYKLDGKLLHKFHRSGSSKLTVEDLEFADDQEIITQSEQDLTTSLTALDSIFDTFGLTMSYPKTETMHTTQSLSSSSSSSTPSKCIVKGHPLKAVNHFQYLGSFISDNGQIDKEISSRISKASFAVKKLKKSVWTQKDLTIHTKLAVYKAVVLTTLLYGCETWCTKKTHIERLETFHTRNLRMLLGIMYSDHVNNHIVRQKAGMMEPVKVLIQLNRLRWLGHVERMEDSRIPKQVLHSHFTEGKRKPGHPNKRWVDCVRDDLKCFDILEKDWAKLCLNREHWRQLLYKGKKIAIEKETEKEILVATKRSKARQAARKAVFDETKHTYYCSFPNCERTFQKKAGLTIHLKKHNATLTSFPCPHCTRICSNKSGLTRHLKTHLTTNMPTKKFSSPPGPDHQN